MAANSRFTIAVHGLSLLAEPGGEWTASDHIAGSIRTNPVVVRRVLRRLLEAGLVEGTRGARGGYRLARPASRLTLAEVYEAVRDEGPLALHVQPPNPACPVGRCIGRHLASVYGEAEAALIDALRRTTLGELRQRLAAEA